MRVKVINPMSLLDKASAIAKRLKAKKSQADGETGELIARHYLRFNGFEFIERVHTPWKITRSGGRVVSAFPVEKVSGDFRAVFCGRSVLVEVKYRPKGKLVHSDLEPHQWHALGQHSKAGGLSLVALVMDKCYLFESCALLAHQSIDALNAAALERALIYHLNIIKAKS